MRQRAHLEAARWFLTKFAGRPEEVVEVVAEHLRLGGDHAQAAGGYVAYHAEGRYSLPAEQAVALGWSRERVLTIDEDLGKSGRTAEGRTGFQRLVTEVTLNHVGMVLGLEMSRLARSSKDWHAFFEMCAIFGTLIADEDGVYDGNDPNDRLLLGLKGIMSEMELHIMRNRLERGREARAGDPPHRRARRGREDEIAWCPS